MNEKLINFIETSFLKELIFQQGVTDISFNGQHIFYLHNTEGRKKSSIEVTNSQVIDFLRQIANFSEKQFSVSTPTLDISVGRYRINAVYTSIVRLNNEKVCSFAMRIGSTESRITNDLDFIDKKCRKYLFETLEKEKSIVIAGPTGSGKTELQKFLLLNLKDFTRVIVIDNVEELENIRINDNIDLTSWQISDSNPNASIQELVRNALRSNPDWIVVAESRGKEMNEVFNSVMTGHPIITTLHAESLEDIPLRICRLIEMADVNQKHEAILNDIYEHMGVCVFVNREISPDQGVKRYVEAIGELQKDKTIKIIYRRNKWLE